MIPQQFKQMFGLKTKQDMNMANNIWKMLDQMAESNPQNYQNFIQKNVKQGLEDAKAKKQAKEKPYKIKPHKGFSLSMKGVLNEKLMQQNQSVVITKKPWSQIKVQFTNSIDIYLNVAHSQRIKSAKLRNSYQKIAKYCYTNLKDIQSLYYSLQGPVINKQKNSYDYCMILNSHFYADLMGQNGGRKALMGLAVSYFQQRLGLDKNPLLRLYNPEQYRRLAYYSIDKYSIEIREKAFLYDGKQYMIEFLLQKDVDSQREEEMKKEQTEKVKQKEKVQKKKEIKFRKEQQEPQIAQIVTKKQQQLPKKVLIEVLKQENQSSDRITYEMKQNTEGYHFQFLLPGVASIAKVQLQMKSDSVRLKVEEKEQLLVKLKKPINQQLAKAKFKKKAGCLLLDVPYK